MKFREQWNRPIERPTITKPSVLTVAYDQGNESIFETGNDEFWKKYQVVWCRQTHAIGYPAPRVKYYGYPHRNTGKVEITLNGLSIYEEKLYPEKYFWPGRTSDQPDHIYEDYDSLNAGLEGLWTDNPGAFDSDDDDEPLGPVDVFFTHLRFILKHYAAELLKRDTVHHLVERHKEEEPCLVDDVFPDRVKPHMLHQVMRRLVDDFISIRPLGRLLETLDETVDQAEGIDELVDACKDRIGDIEEYQFDNFFWSV